MVSQTFEHSRDCLTAQQGEFISMRYMNDWVGVAHISGYCVSLANSLSPSSAPPPALVYLTFAAHPWRLFFPPVVSCISLLQDKSRKHFCERIRTNSSLLHLIRWKCKYGENFCHYLAKHRYHLGCERNPQINIKTCEEWLDALENLDEDTMAFGNIFRYLKNMVSRLNWKDASKRFTRRRTPIPVNITFAGENV